VKEEVVRNPTMNAKSLPCESKVRRIDDAEENKKAR